MDSVINVEKKQHPNIHQDFLPKIIMANIEGN